MALASPPRLGQKSVYVVEDERELAEEVGAELRSRGYLVVVTGSPQSALDAARADQASVLVMDRMIEGVDSLALIELLRKEGGRTPILLMSGLSDVDERIKGLKSGGDDYLVKPFHMKELGARVDALARRLPDSRATRLRGGDIEIDLVAHQAFAAGRPLDLLPREFKLLEYFLRRQGVVVTRSMLLKDVWNFANISQTNVVDVHIGNLRRKLDPSGQSRPIRNIRGEGFVFHVDN